MTREKKPNEQVIKVKRENEEKDEGDLRRGYEKRRTMEGATENGMMLCGPRVATHSLSLFEPIILARRRCCKD